MLTAVQGRHHPANGDGADDVLSAQGADNFADLKTGDLVDFRLIQPMALSVRKLPASSLTKAPVVAAPTLVRTVRPSGALKSAGLDISRTGLRTGDRVGVDVLEGLVVDLLPASATQLTVTRATVILASAFGPVPKGTRVTMATGTAEVVRIARKDHTISLRGPDGQVHNLDGCRALEQEALTSLPVGDLVNFRLIQPLACAIQRQATGRS
jgi:hypothetical protein